MGVGLARKNQPPAGKTKTKKKRNKIRRRNKSRLSKRHQIFTNCHKATGGPGRNECGRAAAGRKSLKRRKTPGKNEAGAMAMAKIGANIEAKSGRNARKKCSSRARIGSAGHEQWRREDHIVAAILYMQQYSTHQHFDIHRNSVAKTKLNSKQTKKCNFGETPPKTGKRKP